MPWYDYPGLSLPSCVRCCNDEPPVACPCVWTEVDFLGVPWPSYADARQYLDDNSADCVVTTFVEGDEVLLALSGDTSVANQLTLTGTMENETTEPGLSLFYGLNLKGGSLLTIAYSITNDPECEEVPCIEPPYTVTITQTATGVIGEDDDPIEVEVVFTLVATPIDEETSEVEVTSMTATILSGPGGASIDRALVNFPDQGIALEEDETGEIEACFTYNFHNPPSGSHDFNAFVDIDYEGEPWTLDFGPSSPDGRFFNAPGNLPCPGSELQMLLLKCVDGVYGIYDFRSVEPATSGTEDFAIDATTAYIVLLLLSADTGVTELSATYVNTSDDDLTVNRAGAMWDDSGTNRLVLACPVLNLPPAAGLAQSYYENLGTAENVLENQTSNCVGFIEGTDHDVFTANDEGVAVRLTGETNELFIEMWAAIELEAGAVVTVGYDVTGAGTVAISATLFGGNGEDSIETETGPGGVDSVIFSAIPYPGTYNIRVRATMTSPGTLAAEFYVDASPNLAVDPVAALYDAGMGCPSIIYCEDAP